MHIRRCYFDFTPILILLLGILFYYFICPVLRFHIKEVIPGLVYRSGELNQFKLSQLIQEKKLKSIINLRGPHPHSLWYLNETQLAEQQNISFFNASIPAKGCPSLEQLKILAETIKTAPTPVLIHCLRGIDRSGLASAIALIINNITSITKINSQISLKYFVLNNKSVGYCVLPAYEKWLTCQRLQSSANNFFTWLNTNPNLYIKNQHC